jgi:hypothetical protein
LGCVGAAGGERRFAIAAIIAPNAKLHDDPCVGRNDDARGRAGIV